MTPQGEIHYRAVSRQKGEDTMILWKLYQLIRGLAPETKCLIFEALRAIRNGERKEAGLKAREAAEREALFKWGRSYLNEKD